MDEINQETKPEAQHKEEPYKEPPSSQQVMTRLGVMAMLIVVLVICAKFFASDDSEDFSTQEEPTYEESMEFDSLPGASGQ